LRPHKNRTSQKPQKLHKPQKLTMKTAILGAGISGIGAARLAKKLGYDLFLSDKGMIPENQQQILNDLGIEWEHGTHTIDKIFDADFVVKSPGIPDQIPLITALHDSNIPVISEIEFASRHTDATLIAITGSNGKTTTTSLTYELLKNAGFNVGLGGNIGQSFAGQVATNDFEYYVLEISSFQLDGIVDFAPHISILTNITPDHLDRYNYDFDLYAHAKMRIRENQTENDHFIYCGDDAAILASLEKYAIKSQLYAFGLEENNKYAAQKIENHLHFFIKSRTFKFLIDALSLQGPHNQLNMMVTTLVGMLLNIESDTIYKTFCNFENLEHRMEKVATLQDVIYINDSKATNVISVQYALETVTQPIIWIVGGVDKGNDYNVLLPLVRQKVKHIVALGKDNQKILKAFDSVSLPIVEAKSMKEAVDAAQKAANAGDCVLLSPACASFDLFKNYEDRGRQFKEMVLA